MRLLLVFISVFCLAFSAQAQEKYTRADSLRGTLNAMRACYDVTFYDLHLRFDPEKKYLSGQNTLRAKLLQPSDTLQVDLFARWEVLEIAFEAKNEKIEAAYRREGNFLFVAVPEKLRQEKALSLRIAYQGQPRKAPNPPWDGGFAYSKTASGAPWVGVACEGYGASSWWPCKDHLSDEPDSMRMTFEVPKGLMAVGNGELRSQDTLGDYVAWEWFVHYPINNYNVTFNLAPYVHFSDWHVYADGDSLKLDYYVLPENVAKAKPHFEQVKGMLDCFEESYGKYPYPKDGYALVETPYWGMEHQGAIAYGNQYQNHPAGFDFIIIHESGHEFFGNSISVKDHAEMWIHESFTTYAETLYLECRYGKKHAVDYLMTQKPRIKNAVSMFGPLGVNYGGWPSADIYYKGAWMLHSLRGAMNNDEAFKKLIRDFYQNFKHQHADTEEVLAFFEKHTNFTVTPFFRHFLTQKKPPVLRWELIRKNKKQSELRYWWESPIHHFNFPVRVRFEGEKEWRWLEATQKKQSLKLKEAPPSPILELDERNFYIELKKL